MKLKKIADQVIVITGATSGIGLTTALEAGKRGAKVVLASRNSRELDQVAALIRRAGGQALGVNTDVSRASDIQALKKAALKKFGRIDTWVNNAGGSIYGKVLETPDNEARQLFDTNFWGLHYGCIAAVEAMKNTGGVIVNLGSEVSERSIAPQTFYSSSKHAVKGYTEGLRSEIERDGYPIYVSLVRPAGIDTPFTQHAINHLEEGAPSLPAPVYAPEVVAQAILACAETGKRDAYAGGASKFFSVLEHVAPGLLDLMVKGKVYDDNTRGSDLPHTKANEGLLSAPDKEGLQRGGHKGHVMESSLYTYVSTAPLAGSILAAAALGGLAWLGVTAVRKEKAVIGGSKAA